jgi:hypothetical protein
LGSEFFICGLSKSTHLPATVKDSAGAAAAAAATTGRHAELHTLASSSLWCRTTPLSTFQRSSPTHTSSLIPLFLLVLVLLSPALYLFLSTRQCSHVVVSLSKYIRQADSRHAQRQQ